MIRSKAQGIFFGVLMSYSMALGMELYNTALNLGVQLQPGGLGNLTLPVLLEALRETVFMGIIVLIVSNLWGNRMGARFAQKHCDPAKDNPYFCRLLRQGGTVAVMCPTMSLIASILFQVVLGDAPLTSLPLIWLGTVLKNFPMAFFWNFFFAAPLCHWAVGLLGRKGASEGKDLSPSQS